MFTLTSSTIICVACGYSVCLYAFFCKLMWNLENWGHVDNKGGYASKLTEEKQHSWYSHAPDNAINMIYGDMSMSLIMLHLIRHMLICPYSENATLDTIYDEMVLLKCHIPTSVNINIIKIPSIQLFTLRMVWTGSPLTFPSPLQHFSAPPWS